MRKRDLVVTVGPAGTGKTYLAMAVAIAALNRHEVSRVVLARPAVEAGEKLGFLPGDHGREGEPVPAAALRRARRHGGLRARMRRVLMERGVIEVAPLAFMRGRTLNDAFVILDEAQNTTSEQMKMFLTRLGFDSKAVVTGDITQIDLPTRQAQRPRRGARRAPRAWTGIGFMRFSEEDVVRHPARAVDHPRLRAQQPPARRGGPAWAASCR